MLKPLSFLSLFCLILWAGTVSSTLLDTEDDCECQHGTCVEDGCECETNWAGSDCSIYDKYLNSDEIALGSVYAGEWKYYRHEVQTAGAKLKWWLNATIGDPDIYIALGSYPDQKNFLARNLTSKEDSYVVVESSQSGVYYAGVYGYLESSYSINVIESRKCPEDCNNQGTCRDGVCSCLPNYGGEWCQYAFVQLTPNSPQLGQVEENGWEYFNTEVGVAGSEMVYTVTEFPRGDGENSDCDLYLAYERTPSRFDFDFVNITLGDESVLVVTNAHAGQYTMGIFGYAGCDFRIAVAINTPEGDCPNRCSNHGSCLRGECSCYNGFEGDSCEWMNAPLVLARPQGGFVGDNAWNFYTARIITNTALIISLAQEGGEGDCDLYVRADEPPTRFQFDYIDQSLAEEFSIIVREPGDHQWYIGVFGWKACAYTLTLDEEKVCACGENNPHGHCEEGSTECMCEAGWGGVDCLFELVELVNGEKTSSSVEQHQWRHYQLPVDGSSAGVVSLKERSSEGLVWLYVSFIEPPTLNSYDLEAVETARGVHEIQISVTKSQTRVMYVGVYGNSFITHGDDALEFDLVAWSAPF